MGNRLAQISLLILSLGLAFAALDAFTEPWRSMPGAVVAETICGHLIALVLSVVCFRAALYFGTRAAYHVRQIREPEL